MKTNLFRLSSLSVVIFSDNLVDFIGQSRGNRKWINLTLWLFIYVAFGACRLIGLNYIKSNIIYVVLGFYEACPLFWGNRGTWIQKCFIQVGDAFFDIYTSRTYSNEMGELFLAAWLFDTGYLLSSIRNDLLPTP